MATETQNLLAARYAELTVQCEAIRAIAMPMRESRDTESCAWAAREAELNEAIRDAESGLYDLENERATIAKALGGKVMSNGLTDEE